PSYDITAGGAVDANYAPISYAPGTLTIKPVALTITADNQTMNYGGIMPALTFNCTGLVNNDTEANLATQPALSTVPASSPAGSYDITAGGAVDANYAPITYAPGTLTIKPVALTITADNQTMN